MTDTHLKMQLEKATVDLDKTTDVEGILIVASDGQILHHNLRVDVDINLFGPMSQVISSSSLRLLNSSGQGEMERVLVESYGGKALFLGLDNVHLIILMQNTANVGMVMVNAKRASQTIHKLTQNLELEIPEEIPIPEEVPIKEVPTEEITKDVPVEEPVPLAKDEPVPELITVSEPPIKTVALDERPVKLTPEETPEMKVETVPGKIEDQTAATPEKVPTVEEIEVPNKVVAEISELTDKAVEETSPESVGESILERTEKITAEPIGEKAIGNITESLTEPSVEESLPIDTKIEVETEMETSETEVEEIIEEIKPSIPTVKPPISFPSLPEHVEIPEDLEKRSQLILEIYESIFLAMSMGAAKIMGVAPARGLTKQFLPFEKCKRLLENVDLKSNATIDFAQIKKNAEEIPISEREEIFIQDFNRMIEVITENYGRVMGYEAFRGMVRPEFQEIKKSYGKAMDELNIKKSIHPEIALLFT
jgi:predicted regulator of Ras-like GTPase activity (Roadblock/LC7/MglB family)